MTADGTKALEAELVSESAISLGRAGTRLQEALDALAAHAGDDEARRELVEDAGERAWEFVVLRSALGWHDDLRALDAYGVPVEVRARMGVRRRTTT